MKNRKEPSVQVFPRFFPLDPEFAAAPMMIHRILGARSFHIALNQDSSRDTRRLHGHDDNTTLSNVTDSGHFLPGRFSMSTYKSCEARSLFHQAAPTIQPSSHPFVLLLSFPLFAVSLLILSHLAASSLSLIVTSDRTAMPR